LYTNTGPVPHPLAARLNFWLLSQARYARAGTTGT
jgi:hypothetical protein